jgi:hypothetical protein
MQMIIFLPHHHVIVALQQTNYKRPMQADYNRTILRLKTHFSSHSLLGSDIFLQFSSSAPSPLNDLFTPPHPFTRISPGRIENDALVTRRGQGS